MKLEFRIVILLFFVVCFSCSKSTNKNDICKISNVYFYFEHPCHCKNEKLNSIDSHAGSIKCDSLTIIWDYGYSSYSTHEAYTAMDFVQQNKWLSLAIAQKLPKGIEYNLNDIIQQVEILEVNFYKREAKFKYNNQVYHYKIEVPDYLDSVQEKSDTTNGIIRRLIFPRYEIENQNKYIFKYQIIRNTKNSNTDFDSEALILHAECSNLKDTSVIFNVFHSAKLN